MRSNFLLASIVFVAFAAVAAPGGAQTPEEQLRDLKRLRDAGLISDPVYAEQQRRILEGGAPKPAPARAAAAEKSTTHSKAPPVGATLTYRLHDKLFPSRPRAFTVKIWGVNGTQIEEVIEAKQAEPLLTQVDAQSVRFAHRDVGEGRRFVELSPYLLNAATASGLPNPPTHYPLGGSAEPFKVRVTSIVEDLISVPAGTFKTVRVEVSGERGTSGFIGRGGDRKRFAVTRFRYTAWYSADLNRYVMLRHQQWNPSGEPIRDEVVQLVNFSAK